MADIELTNNSDIAREDLERALLRGLEACGMTAETYAKQGCPVDTGRLRNSIAHQVKESEKAAYIGSNVEYAPYQEMGTSTGITAKHFLKNAAGNHSAEYQNIIKSSMENA